jgi:hypothetical protein
MIKDHIANRFLIVPDDLDLSPFDSKGGLGRFYQVFGNDYQNCKTRLMNSWWRDMDSKS